MPFQYDGGGDVSFVPNEPSNLESVTFAPPLEGALPGVSQLPTGGQGVALDLTGALPVSAPASALSRRTADPEGLTAGMIWIRADLHEIRFRDENGVTYKLAGVAV
jgi:hypothetical protein